MDWGMNEVEWTEKAKLPNTDLAGWGLSWVFTACPLWRATALPGQNASQQTTSGGLARSSAHKHSSSGLKLGAAPKSARRWYLAQSESCTATAADVYDILPSPTAVFCYAIRSTKLSANEQFFAGAQTAVILLQTTHIKQCVSFIAANKVYTSTNKTTIVWIETELFFSSSFFLPGVDASRV